MKNGLPTVSLTLTLDKRLFSIFVPLLQGGFKVKVQVGCSLASLLREQFALEPEYVKERVKTIFLDGKPVDDQDAALIQDGSTLALSAAMPGLAGATLRSGGFFAALRSQITHREDKGFIPPGEGFISLKLFNLLISEMGPIFLRRGVYLSREEFETFLKTAPDEFWEGCREARSDGRELEAASLKAPNGLRPFARVLLSARFSP